MSQFEREAWQRNLHIVRQRQQRAVCPVPIIHRDIILDMSFYQRVGHRPDMIYRQPAIVPIPARQDAA